MMSITPQIKWPSRSRLLKEGIVLVWVQLLVISPNHAGFWNKANPESTQSFAAIEFNNKEILQDSFISYKAVGGFTGVKSFSVVLSCQKGKISVLKTIHNPKNNRRHPTIRHRQQLDKESYLELWKNLQKQNIFQINNAKEPRRDILDEFTIHFKARVGPLENKFKIYGISRPEGSRYFALKSVIDRTTNMASLWDHHSTLVRK